MQSLSAPPPVNSVLAFYMKSGMTEDEFAQISADVVGSTVTGLVNVNTASAEVLACIPGIGTDKAPALVTYRQTNPDKLTSVAWVSNVLERTNIVAAGPYLTGQSYQYSADIAAVGHHGRGYRRTRFVFDLSAGAPTIKYRQDLTHLGWAIGKRARESLLLAKNLR
jgi:type II secretory pathway component PulK